MFVKLGSNLGIKRTNYKQILIRCLIYRPTDQWNQSVDRKLIRIFYDFNDSVSFLSLNYFKLSVLDLFFSVNRFLGIEEKKQTCLNIVFDFFVNIFWHFIDSTNNWSSGNIKCSWFCWIFLLNCDTETVWSVYRFISFANKVRCWQINIKY